MRLDSVKIKWEPCKLVIFGDLGRVPLTGWVSVTILSDITVQHISVMPTLGSSTAKEQNRTYQCNILRMSVDLWFTVILSLVNSINDVFEELLTPTKRVLIWHTEYKTDVTHRQAYYYELHNEVRILDCNAFILLQTRN